MWGYRFEVASISGVRKWSTKRGFNTKAEAAKSGRDAQLEYEHKGKVVISSEMSYSDFLDLWLRSLNGVLKTTTIENYTRKAKLYLKPYLGTRKLNTITKNDMREVLISLASKGCSSKDAGLSKNTLSVIKGMMQKSFSFAVDENLLPVSPVAGRFPLPVRESFTSRSRPAATKPHVYIPQSRIKEIFARFPEGTSPHIAMMFGYKCGLRIGEAFAVTWDDIDFEKGTLSVNRQVQWRKDSDADKNDPRRRVPKHDVANFGFWYISDPKYNSIRTMKLDDEFIALLQKEKKQQEKDRAYYDDQYFYYYIDERGRITRTKDKRSTPIHFVSVRRDGEFISPRTMQHTSKIIHESLKYTEFDFHSLRHTHATMLVENGASPIYVQYRLGHKNLDVTLRVYFHYTGKIADDGAEIVAKMFNISDEC